MPHVCWDGWMTASRKHETFTQCRHNVDPPSAMLAPHWASCVCWCGCLIFPVDLTDRGVDKSVSPRPPIPRHYRVTPPPRPPAHNPRDNPSCDARVKVKINRSGDVRVQDKLNLNSCPSSCSTVFMAHWSDTRRQRRNTTQSEQNLPQSSSKECYVRIYIIYVLA